MRLQYVPLKAISGFADICNIMNMQERYATMRPIRVFLIASLSLQDDALEVINREIAWRGI